MIITIQIYVTVYIYIYIAALYNYNIYNNAAWYGIHINQQK
jgi:hypothetical protein